LDERIKSMKVLILGGMGYLGWPTACHFQNLGHEVQIVDNYSKSELLDDLKVEVLFEPEYALNQPIMKTHCVDITSYEDYAPIVESFKPDTIIHYAEQPSAPYSEQDMDAGHFTLMNNIEGTFNVVRAVKEFVPDCHIIKLGTMGEYGAPNIDIEEGFIDIKHNGREDRFLYPRQSNSLYHTSKIMDTDMLFYYCRVHNIKVSDIMQGPVYGFQTPDAETSFYYDSTFGTVLNRFMAQAISGQPLTVYGAGEQTKGFLNLTDVVQSIQLVAENPPENGKMEIYNQFTELFTVNELAEKVQRIGKIIGIDVEINHIENPRVEKDKHYFNVKHEKLLNLGLRPTLLTDGVLLEMMAKLYPYQTFIDTKSFEPKVKWSK